MRAPQNNQVQRRPVGEARSHGGGADPDVRCNDQFCEQPENATC